VNLKKFSKMDMTNVDVSLDEVIRMNKAKNVQVQKKQGNHHKMKGHRQIEIKRQSGGPPPPPSLAAAAPPVKPTNSPKILINNLASNVTAGDLEELFSEIGELQSFPVLHHDSRGKFLGSAEVTFQMRADARKALQKYNGVALDGRPLRIQFTINGDGGGMASRLSGQAAAAGTPGHPPALMQQPVSQHRPAGGSRTVIPPRNEGRGFRPGGGFGGGQRGAPNFGAMAAATQGSGQLGDRRNKKKKEEIDPDQLDAEMDTYMAKHPGSAMC